MSTMFADTCGWLLAAETGGHVLHFTLRPLLEPTGLPLALGGMFLVLVAMALVVLFASYLPLILSRVERLVPVVESIGQQALGSLSDARRKLGDEEADDLDADENLMVVLAAAVAVAISEPHRIVFARSHSDNLAWAREGRRQIHTSHRVN
jgi:hypothetical protein